MPTTSASLLLCTARAPETMALHISTRPRPQPHPLSLAPSQPAPSHLYHTTAGPVYTLGSPAGLGLYQHDSLIPATQEYCMQDARSPQDDQTLMTSSMQSLSVFSSLEHPQPTTPLSHSIPVLGPIAAAHSPFSHAHAIGPSLSSPRHRPASVEHSPSTVSISSMSSSPPIPVAVSFEEMATAVPVIACAACKKSHIKCDSGRPCQNCLKNPNKAATCRDAVPKPRGRPKGGSKAAANALREAKLQFEQQFHQQQFQQQMRRQHSHHGLSFSHSRPALAPHSMTPMSRMSPIQTDGFHFSGHPHPALSRSTPTSPAAMDHRPILPGRRPSLPAWRSMCPYNNGHSSPLPGSVPEFADEEQASSPLATAGGAWPAVTAAMSESAMMAPSLCFPSTTSLLATTTAGTAVMMNPSGMLATTPYGMAPTTPGSVATSPNLNHPGLVDGLHAHAAGYSLVDVQAYSPQPMMENPYFAMSHHQQHSHHQSMMSLGMPTSTALHSMHGYYPETPLDAESLESMTDDVTSDDSDESETVDMVAQAGLVYGHAPTAKLPTELHLQMLYSPRPC